jgi:putative nucleotidyltransferase with HDIG domain
MHKRFTIPEEITQVTATLEAAGFEAYLVGGCVRDLIRGVSPKDWDVTTNANPDQIIKLFPKTFYENEYGTVGVVNEAIPEGDTEKGTLRVVEVTPYRKETTYSDFRRPDEVVFSGNLHDDLLRRDFTMNAIAYGVAKGELVDPYAGQEDIERHLIRTVGKAEDRFHEDALRVMRAVRFGAELGFAIEKDTMDAIVKFAHRLEKIAAERIRDEFTKMIMSERPMEGIILLHRTGVLKYVMPELEQGLGCEQNGDHIYHVWEHNLRALQHSAERQWPLHVRIAALLHDVAKPATRKWSDEKKDWTFYGHDVVGGRMATKMLERLHFPKQFTIDVATLVRYHLFFSDIEKITLSAVRRIVANVG